MEEGRGHGYGGERKNKKRGIKRGMLREAKAQ
jgi:hypothetical protein